MGADGYLPITDEAAKQQQQQQPSSMRRIIVATVSLGCVAGAASVAATSRSVTAAAHQAAFDIDYAMNVEACVSWDDDAAWGWMCGKNDYHAWCNESSTTGYGTGFNEFCSDACSGDDPTANYAMVCAWEAISRLDEVCAGTFVATTPANLSNNLPNTFDLDIDLYNCDEHAFCNSCADDNDYCRAVARHYGGVGVPYNYSGVEYTYMDALSSVGELIGANAAMRVLNEDLEYWCGESTLSRVAVNSVSSKKAADDAAAAWIAANAAR